MSNLSDLIDALAGNASQAIKVAGATLGLIADLSGAIGGIISGSEFILQQLGVVQTDTEQLLNEIDRVYTALAAEARGQDIINRVNFIALVLGPSQAVVQNLQLLINASPPLTQVQAIEQIELCLTALNVLQNADWALPSGDPIYWTDSGVYLLDPPFGDVGYGEISPTPDQNDLVFNYTYFLQAYLSALLMFVTVAAALDPNYAANYAGTPSTPGPLRLAATALFGVLSTIQGGITPLGPGPFPAALLKELYISKGSVYSWTIQELWYAIFRERGGGQAPYTGLTFIVDSNNVPTASLEFGAVDKYSGFSAMDEYQLPFEPLMDTNSPLYSQPWLDVDPKKFAKFRVRLLRRQKEVYIQTGMRDVRMIINYLNAIVGDPPLSGLDFGNWSFRELLTICNSPSISGIYHLRPLAQLLKHTFPLDTSQTDFVTSFQELLSH
jgi:hypothetical protein